MSKVVLKNAGRREFLRAVLAAAAAGITIANASMFAPAAVGSDRARLVRRVLEARRRFRFLPRSRFRMTRRRSMPAPATTILCRGRILRWC